ncbi:hypothetical protein ACJIZ3_024780 [Penstemon smallii]|uniref:BZIP domain-containing protein n=1 Tax=Penstemon smallii TaxID=265156 RepID=A0ABD3TSU1_9LAMI
MVMDEEVWKDLTLSSRLHPPTPEGDLDLRIFPSQPEKTPYLIIPPDLTTSTNNSLRLCRPCSAGRKRATPSPTIDENVTDRKRKRLMKNRESAARSRARKQAYTYELESEIAHLLEENAKLRKQVEKLSLAAPGLDEGPNTKKLHRTLSNPF